ncbi:MAG: metallophosphoesterase family protein [Burkholderiaceae bacterium]
MRLLILSDLHHELWREHAPRIDLGISRPDVVILAGDINTGAKAVQWAAQTFPGLPVLYVHGNHEGYGEAIDAVQAEIQAACASTDNVHFLDCGEYIIGQQTYSGNKMKNRIKKRRFYTRQITRLILPKQFIKDTLKGLAEANAGQLTPYLLSTDDRTGMK